MNPRIRLRRYEIAHESMTPTLQPGDYVAARRTTDLDRGDIVIVEHPTRPGTDLVKRVIGLPGEDIAIAEGRVLVDGAPMADPWAIGLTEPAGSWTLHDAVFLLSDQRTRTTTDGRTIGPYPLDREIWRVQFRYWPVRRLGAVR